MLQETSLQMLYKLMTLNKGDYSNPSNGTKLEGILKDHPKASDADYTISTVREDEFKKELTVFL